MVAAASARLRRRSLAASSRPAAAERQSREAACQPQQHAGNDQQAEQACRDELSRMDAAWLADALVTGPQRPVGRACGRRCRRSAARARRVGAGRGSSALPTFHSATPSSSSGSSSASTEVRPSSSRVQRDVVRHLAVDRRASGRRAAGPSASSRSRLPAAPAADEVGEPVHDDDVLDAVAARELERRLQPLADAEDRRARARPRRRR